MSDTSVPGYRILIEEPPEPFQEEFPMVSELIVFEHGGNICLYVPEDDAFITDPHDVLKWLYILMPIIKPSGGCQVQIREEES